MLQSRPRWHMIINIISIKKVVWVLAPGKMLFRSLGVFLGQAEGEIAVCSIKHIGMFTPRTIVIRIMIHYIYIALF